VGIPTLSILEIRETSEQNQIPVACHAVRLPLACGLD
jgi:hypothetical protein